MKKTSMAQPRQTWRIPTPNQTWNWKLMRMAAWLDRSVLCGQLFWRLPQRGDLTFLKGYLEFARNRRRPHSSHHGARNRAIDKPLDPIWAEFISIHDLKHSPNIC